jgi:antitoxin YefM
LNFSRIMTGTGMDSVTFDQALTSLGSLMDEVCATRGPTAITREDGESAVLMSLRDYAGLQETLHLLQSPRNASRLLESIAQLQQGKTQPRELFRRSREI